MIKWFFIFIVGLYLLLIFGSPIFLAVLHQLNPGPKNKQEAVKRGNQLLEQAKTVIAVGAHPDDIEWYAGGTLAALIKKGVDVIVIMATDGGKNSDPKARRKEQLKAAKTIGYKKVIFLEYPDGALADQSQEDVINKMKMSYKEYKADTIITFDPYEQAPLYHHPDHIAAGKAAIEAAKQTNIKQIYLFHSGRSNTWVNIAGGIDAKIEGRAAHKSQTKWFLTPFGMNYILKETAWLDGRKVGLTYAEPFYQLEN